MPVVNALTLWCGDAGCEKGVSRADTTYFGRSQKRKLNGSASKIPWHELTRMSKWLAVIDEAEVPAAEGSDGSCS